MENNTEEKIEVKAVDSSEDIVVTPQEKEAAVLEQAVESGEVSEEYGLQEDGVYKINVDKEPNKKEENAIQERETTEVSMGERTGDSQEVDGEVRVESNQEDNSKEQEVEQTTDESPLELVKEETDVEQKEVEEKPTALTKEQIVQDTNIELPEGVDKLIKFMEDTGGTVEDYTRLNRDIEKIDNVSLVREYYEYTKPHLNKEDVDFLMDKNFAYDAELDEASDIKAKQLAFKEELFNAKNTFNKVKEQYYNDLKLRKKDNIDPEYKEAFEYYNKQKQQQEARTKFTKDFNDKTNRVFSDNFKGFDFKVGENKYRFKVDNPEKTKKFQSDITNFLNQFEVDGGAKDVDKYHKALFAAQNADKIANHFYEQGRADAIKDSARKAKNINMDPRSDASSVITKSGDTIRVVSGESSDKLRIKWK
jgi:5-hydroxyisourate hydrolase-like protein (transthyretin family)